MFKMKIPPPPSTWNMYSVNRVGLTNNDNNNDDDNNNNSDDDDNSINNALSQILKESYAIH